MDNKNSVTENESVTETLPVTNFKLTDDIFGEKV